MNPMRIADLGPRGAECRIMYTSTGVSAAETVHTTTLGGDRLARGLVGTGVGAGGMGGTEIGWGMVGTGVSCD